MDLKTGLLAIATGQFLEGLNEFVDAKIAGQSAEEPGKKITSALAQLGITSGMFADVTTDAEKRPCQE